jgi:hypothetical protein
MIAMAGQHTRTLFMPMPIENGRRWRVEAQWPDGATQHVEDFVSDYAACDWISNRSAAWLLKHHPAAEGNAPPVAASSS